MKQFLKRKTKNRVKSNQRIGLTSDLCKVVYISENLRPKLMRKRRKLIAILRTLTDCVEQTEEKCFQLTNNQKKRETNDKYVGSPLVK